MKHRLRHRTEPRDWLRPWRAAPALMCCCAPSTSGMIIAAGTGPSQASGKPNVFAFDGNGNILWTYNTGFFSSIRKTVDGIARDSSGNVYLSWWASNVGGTNAGFGIQQLDKNGNFLQEYKPSGWTVGTWSLPGQLANIHGGNPNTLFFAPDGHLYWQHIGRQNGVNKFDCISKLAVTPSSSFLEVGSWGGSNFSAAWSSSGVTPSAPGKIVVDSSGNIWNQFPQTSKTNGCLCKISQAGSLLFNHSHCVPIASSGWNYILDTGISNGFFDLNTEAVGALGYIGTLVTPDWNTNNGGESAFIDKIFGGAVVGWCTGNTDDCNSPIPGTGLTNNKATLALILDSATITNSVGQSPVSQKSACDWAWPTIDRFNANANINMGLSVCFMPGTGNFAVTFDNDCVRAIPDGTRNCFTGGVTQTLINKTRYGLATISGSTGALIGMRSADSIMNRTLSSGNYNLQSSCYLKSAGIISSTGSHLVSAASHPSIYGFDLTLATKWRYDLTSNGTSVTGITCMYADRT